MLVIVTYIVDHLISPLLLRKKELSLLLVLNLAAFVVIYVFKEDTYDLITYTMGMDWPFVFEVGYAVLATVLKAIFRVNRVALYAVQVLLALLFCVPAFVITKKTESRAVYVIIVLLSVAFTLGVNNAIRQAFSSLFIILSLMLLFQGRYFYSLLLFGLSFLFHYSGVAFFAYSLVAYLAARALFFPWGNSLKRKLSSPLFFGLLIIVAILTYYALSIVLSLGFYEDFGVQSFSVDSTRTSNTIKILVVFVSYVASELLFGQYEAKESYFTNFRLLRTAFIFLLIGLATRETYYELSARVLYFYFVVEMVVMVAAYHIGKRRGVALLLATYAFAINVINVLKG